MDSESKIRVIIAAGLYPPDIGGPATYAAMVAERLPTEGFSVGVVPYGAVRMVPKWRRHLTFTQRLWQATYAADVLYALDGVSVGLPALIVSRLRGIPLVVRLGGDYAWEQGSQRFGITDTLDVYTKRGAAAYGLRVRVLAWLQRTVVRRAALTITPSVYLQTIVRSWPQVSAERVAVVYSALFPLPAPATREQVRTQLDYQGLTVITAARLVPWKGMSGLLEAVMAVPDATLVIAGDGPERKVLEEQIATNDWGSRVRLVGSLSKEALGAAIYGADIFAYNTAYEGLSHQLLEVMDLGVPIITTKVGGNPELLDDGVSGKLVDHNDSAAFTSGILSLARSADLRERYVQNARIRVTHFSKEQSVAEIAKLLKSVVI